MGSPQDKKHTTVIVVAEPNHPALNLMPIEMENVKFIVFPPSLCETNQNAIEFESPPVVVWLPPSDPKALSALWSLLKNKPTWLHSLSAGVDMIATFVKETLLDSPTVLTNGRGAFTSSLAEYVMASALHFNKQVPRLQANKQERKWDNFVMPVLRGKTMGFLGFGDIPRSTAKIAKQAFHMRIIALRRNQAKSQSDSELVDQTLNIETEKLELFKQADFVVAVLPGTPETQNFVGAEEFAAMKPSAIFISIGRGVTVDEDALVNALKTKQIAGAAIDVYKQEPLPAEHPLWECENVLMSSHNADLTEDYFELAWNVWANNFEAYQNGSNMSTPVDKSLGY